MGSIDIDEEEFNRIIEEKRIAKSIARLGAAHEGLEQVADIHSNLSEDQQQMLEEKRNFVSDFFEDDILGGVDTTSFNMDQWRNLVNEKESSSERRQFATQVDSEADEIEELRSQLYNEALGHSGPDYSGDIDVEVGDEIMDEFRIEVENIFQDNDYGGPGQDYFDAKFNQIETELESINQEFKDLDQMAETYFNNLIETVTDETLSQNDITTAVETALNRHGSFLDEDDVYNQVRNALEDYDFEDDIDGAVNIDYDAVRQALVQGISNSNVATTGDISDLEDVIYNEHDATRDEVRREHEDTRKWSRRAFGAAAGAAGLAALAACISGYDRMATGDEHEQQGTHEHAGATDTPRPTDEPIDYDVQLSEINSYESVIECLDEDQTDIESIEEWRESQGYSRSDLGIKTSPQSGEEYHGQLFEVSSRDGELIAEDRLTAGIDGMYFEDECEVGQ